jgi:hypothetical protein
MLKNNDFSLFVKIVDFEVNSPLLGLGYAFNWGLKSRFVDSSIGLVT